MAKPRHTRDSLLRLALGLLIGLAASGGAATATAQGRPAGRPCERSLWGCRSQPPSTTPSDKVPVVTPPPVLAEDEEKNPAAVRAAYDALLSKARNAIGFMRTTGSADTIGEALHPLHEAIRLVPKWPEAWSLLGQALVEGGRFEVALAPLEKARGLLLSESDEPERLDPGLELALALLEARAGDFATALDRNRRLLRNGVISHRTLGRTGDLLLAMGRLEEALPLLERACDLPRGSSTPLEVARACVGYAMALDRGRRSPSLLDKRLRQLSQRDSERRVVRVLDFVPGFDRDYARALLAGRSCQQVTALKDYLRGARAASPKEAVPPGYLRRAEERLAALLDLRCSDADPGPGVPYFTLPEVPR